MNPVPAFASTYVEARHKFRSAAAARGLAVETHEHPSERGAEGEPLATDIALLGSASAEHVLLLTSATHGVEGFCGSGVQVALLEDDDFVQAVGASGVALLLYHALNPYGFSFLRRGNEDNVDMNRNFRDFSAAAPPNHAYAEVHDFIVPATWPPAPDDEARMRAYIARRGAKALQAAVSGGQCDFPHGLFYGGSSPSWSNNTLRDVLRRRGGGRARLAWIDVHTGLGPYGHGEKIYSGPADAAMIARARAIWGADVTSFHDGSSTSAPLTGVTYHAIDECPGVEYTGIALEFGTVPFAAALAALRAEQWLHNHPGATALQRSTIKRAMRDAFYADSDDWKAMVYGQSRVACLQAIRALAAAPPPRPVST